MSEYKLKDEIIKKSQALTWDKAMLEWSLESADFGDGDDDCLCGRKNITELCTIKNKYTNETVIVGNSCVNKFLGLSSKKLFDVIKRIQKKIENAPNAKLIDYAYDKGWITTWEYGFSLDTFRRTKLSDPQLSVRRKINSKILKGFKKNHK